MKEESKDKLINKQKKEIKKVKDIMKLNRDTFMDELPEKVLSALKYLYPTGYHDQSKRQSIAKTLRRIAVEKFSWDGIAKRLLN